MQPRYTVALLCFAANVIAHCDRVSLSVAVPSLMTEFGWDTAEMGGVLSAFFTGYALFMIPVGAMVNRFGPRKVFAMSMGFWSLFTLLTPLARSAQQLSAMRFLLGVGESGTAACINGTLARWFPPGEFARAAGLCWSAGYFGPILAFPLASWLLAQFGWRAIFLVFGAVGFLWLPLWLRTAELVRDGGLAQPVPWRRLLSRREVWGVFGLHFSSNWILYVMITWLPAYLTTARGFQLGAGAAGASLPFLCAWIGTNVFAQWNDRVPAERRRIFLVPYAACAVLIFLVPSAPTQTATVAILCLAMAMLSAVTPIFSSASMRIAPDFAGPLAAVQNAFANLAGIIAPAAVGWLVKWYGWEAAFALTATVCAGGTVSYWFCADRTGATGPTGGRAGKTGEPHRP